VKRYARLYWVFLAQWLKTAFAYRANLALGLLSTMAQQAIGLLVVWGAMLHVPRLNGWTYDQILFAYGLLTLAKALSHLVADNLWNLGQVYLRAGRLDPLLVRPVNPLFHLLVDRFSPEGLGYLLMGLVLVLGSAPAMGIAWTWLKLLYLLIAVLSGGAIFIGLNLLTASMAFFVMDALPLTLAVFQTHQLAQYPLSIYRRNLRLVVTWVVPYCFASYIPAGYLLHREVGWMALAGPSVAVGLLVAGYRLWLFGLTHHGSTGT